MLRIIMMGTGAFAVPTLRGLLAGPHRVELLVTRPPRELHGKQQAEANPMRELGRERGLAIFEPESINTDAARAELAKYQPDLFVVCDYGQILRPETLAVARLGGINLHASLLPKYRGAAPINWAVYHGETVTGDTVIHMSPAIDAGPAILQAELPIGPDDTAAELEPRLAELGVLLVAQAIEQLVAGTAQPIAQDPAQATRAPRLEKNRWPGRLVAARPPAIRNQVRAACPGRRRSRFWQRPAGEPLRVILEKVSVVDGAGPPGTVLEAAGERLLIATGTGAAGHRADPAGRQTHSLNRRVLARLPGASGRAVWLTSRSMARAGPHSSDPAAGDQRDYQQHEEHEEEDPGCLHRYAGKHSHAERAGDQGNDEKDQSVAEHARNPREVSGAGSCVRPVASECFAR